MIIETDSMIVCCLFSRLIGFSASSYNGGAPYNHNKMGSIKIYDILIVIEV